LTSPNSFEDYTTRPLGSGGFSNVFLVTNPATNESFVHKRILKDKTPDEDIFYNEISANRILGPLGIVPKYLSHGETDSYYYLNSEFMPDYVDLFQWFGESFPLHQSVVSSIYRKILKGCILMSDYGICHNDIKPENILIHPETLDIKFIDFGFAETDLKQNGGLTTNPYGTESYMCPAKLRCYLVKSDPYCALLSDVWSATAILYDLLSPFTTSAVRDRKLSTLEGKASVDLIDFLRTVLETKDNSLTIDRILNHSWMISADSL